MIYTPTRSPELIDATNAILFADPPEGQVVGIEQLRKLSQSLIQEFPGAKTITPTGRKVIDHSRSFDVRTDDFTRGAVQVSGYEKRRWERGRACAFGIKAELVPYGDTRTVEYFQYVDLGTSAKSEFGFAQKQWGNWVTGMGQLSHEESGISYNLVTHLLNLAGNP